MKTIVIATKNKGKIREMTQAFEGLPVKLIPLSDFGDLPDAVEDGTTFEANAKIKALFYMKETKTACLADDSGLEVDALGGFGVDSLVTYNATAEVDKGVIHFAVGTFYSEGGERGCGVGVNGYFRRANIVNSLVWRFSRPEMRNANNVMLEIGNSIRVVTLGDCKIRIIIKININSIHG